MGENGGGDEALLPLALALAGGIEGDAKAGMTALLMRGGGKASLDGLIDWKGGVGVRGEFKGRGEEGRGREVLVWDLLSLF